MVEAWDDPCIGDLSWASPTEAPSPFRNILINDPEGSLSSNKRLAVLLGSKAQMCAA